MSGPFESVRWNACVHTIVLGVYSHLKFGGMESELILTPRGKSPPPEAQRRIEPVRVTKLPDAWRQC